jgi:hypothetical protein
LVPLAEQPTTAQFERTMTAEFVIFVVNLVAILSALATFVASVWNKKSLFTNFTKLGRKRARG